jgi:hypothetical protein
VLTRAPGRAGFTPPQVTHSRTPHPPSPPLAPAPAAANAHPWTADVCCRRCSAPTWCCVRWRPRIVGLPAARRLCRGGAPGAVWAAPARPWAAGLPKPACPLARPLAPVRLCTTQHARTRTHAHTHSHAGPAAQPHARTQRTHATHARNARTRTRTHTSAHIHAHTFAHTHSRTRTPTFARRPGGGPQARRVAVPPLRLGALGAGPLPQPGRHGARRGAGHRDGPYRGAATARVNRGGGGGGRVERKHYKRAQWGALCEWEVELCVNVCVCVERP